MVLYPPYIPLIIGIQSTALTQASLPEIKPKKTDPAVKTGSVSLSEWSAQRVQDYSTPPPFSWQGLLTGKPQKQGEPNCRDRDHYRGHHIAH